jgi:hypothetical protein
MLSGYLSAERPYFWMRVSEEQAKLFKVFEEPKMIAKNKFYF